MQRNKMILALVVAIAIVVTVFSGCVTQVSEEGPIQVVDISSVTGLLSSLPSAIEVSDSNPFFALIATPLDVNYDNRGEQHVSPLYIVNMSNPSTAIIRTMEMVGIPPDFVIDDSKSAKEWSLEIAKNFWKKSKVAMLIQDNKSGYALGVNALPIASYLSIPVIVTSEIDKEVKKTLDNLGVKYSIICGDLQEYKQSIKFTTVEEIVNASITLVKKKFGDVEYVTLANPIDAWPPKVLDSTEFSFGPEKIKSATMMDNMVKFLYNTFTGSVKWEFTIPDDYKYALVELDGYNHDIDGVEKFGDAASFAMDPADGGPPLLGYGAATDNGIPVRDENGNIVEDRVHVERVLYDCGGKKYIVTATGKWAIHKKGTVSAKVTIKKLDSPYYPMMKGLSAVAPYLTAYHRGILFAKPEFAFVADDNVLTADGKTCPGFYLPGLNPDLVPMSNNHVYRDIHEPLNRILAKIANISYENGNNLRELWEHYYSNPIYIALVGGHTVLPRYYYESHVEPLDDAFAFGGGGSQTDDIYGNIDPIENDWSNLANDTFTKYPQVENIVGRIIGWDVQDADALVVRTIFYNNILRNLGDWKNNYGVIVGGGIDFQKPLPLYIISKLPGAKMITNMLSPMVDLQGPWKYDTGFNKILKEAISKTIGEAMGFKVKDALDNEGMLKGLSDEAIKEIKTKSLWNRLTFSKRQVKKLIGEENVKGKEILETSNFLFVNAHGSNHRFGVPGPNLVAAGFDGVILNAPNLWQKIIRNIIPVFMVGFWGPGGDLEKVGSYSSRSISSLKLGPSVMWLESCFCGKINGLYPKESLPPTFIHAGLNALIASTTSSNIPGGYLEPKKHMYDTIFSTKRAYNQAKKNAEKGNYSVFHFGIKIYHDMCQELKENNTSIGRAFRDAKNKYLPSDADWNLWWSPPLCSTLNLKHIRETGHGASEEYGPHLKSKYTSFREYVLYGDPAFNPYEPCNNG